VTWSSDTSCGTTNVTSGNPGTATCTTSSLNAGTDAITANYSGDANHTGGTGTLSSGQVVNQATQTITATPPANAYKSDSFTVLATGGASGQPLVYASSGDCTNSGATYTAGTKAGSCSGTITQAGNTNYAAATPFTWTTNIITKLAAPAVSLSGAPTTAVGGSSFAVTATYPNTQGVPPVVPTITAAGACSVGAATGSGTSYQATVTMIKGSGTCTATAKWAANFYYAAATADEKTTAELTKPTTTFIGAPPTAVGGSTFTVTATSNESGTYASTPTITASGACTAGAVTGTGSGSYESTITITEGSGTCTTTAKWAASIEYAASTVAQKTTAERAAPTVSLTGAPASSPNGSQFTVTASSNEAGSYAATPTITATGGDCTVGSVTSTGSGSYQATVTMTKATGTCTMTAKWLETIEYAAESATQKTTAAQ
jgi:hypothetical protein